jgi:hypothetical protein
MGTVGSLVSVLGFVILIWVALSIAFVALWAWAHR